MDNNKAVSSDNTVEFFKHFFDKKLHNTLY